MIEKRKTYPNVLAVISIGHYKQMTYTSHKTFIFSLFFVYYTKYINLNILLSLRCMIQCWNTFMYYSFRHALLNINVLLSGDQDITMVCWYTDFELFIVVVLVSLRYNFIFAWWCINVMLFPFIRKICNIATIH